MSCFDCFFPGSSLRSPAHTDFYHHTYNPKHGKTNTEHEYARCGICEQPGVTRVWWSEYSVGAHSSCWKELVNIEAEMKKAINVIFDDAILKNEAHRAGIKAVKKQFKGVPIKTFLDCYGEEKLKCIFDSVGVSAVINYAAHFKLKSNDAYCVKIDVVAKA